MKKLHFTKRTISKLENLDTLKGGAANGNNETFTPNSQNGCTYTLPTDCSIPASENPNCPLDPFPTSRTRTTEGRSKESNA